MGLLVDELATALDVYIGYSAESTAEVEDSQIEEAAGKVKKGDIVKLKNDRHNELYYVYDVDEKGLLGLETVSDKHYDSFDMVPQKDVVFVKREMKEAAGKYALSVDGKIWSKSGKPVHFANAKSAKSAQSKASEKMKDKKVEVVKLEEAAADDTTEVEKAWKASKDKKPVIKKYGLAQGISSLRPGEIKLGIRNQMNGKRSFAALDDKGDLIVISGTSSAPKIRFVK